MNNVSFAQYNKLDYPLKKFTLDEMPSKFFEIICSAEKNLNGIIRGGLAYSLLMKDAKYVMSDVDLIYLHSGLCSAVEFYSDTADYVFVNHNAFSDTVLTAFWRSIDGSYYKIDALILESFPPTISIEWKNHAIRSVDGFYLWHDRMLKISQRKIRGLTELKTKSHISIVKNLVRYLLEDDTLIPPPLPCDIEGLVHEAVQIVSELLSSAEAEGFNRLQENLLMKVRS